MTVVTQSRPFGGSEKATASLSTPLLSPPPDLQNSNNTQNTDAHHHDPREKPSLNRWMGESASSSSAQTPRQPSSSATAAASSASAQHDVVVVKNSEQPAPSTKDDLHQQQPKDPESNSSSKPEPIHPSLQFALQQYDKSANGNSQDNSQDKSNSKQQQESPELIDNTTLTYVPLRLPHSQTTVRVRPQVLTHCPAILSELDQDLVQCQRLLPQSVQLLIRRTVLWINHTYRYGPKHQPIVLNHSTAHHHPAWLLGARDIAEKTLGIEIYNCFDFQRMRLHWNGCGLILHELCHLIHQHALGLLHPQIEALYQIASSTNSKNNNKKKWQNVVRRDWAGKSTGETDLHYAMVNHKEFFAELSVTYLATGYPHLDKATPRSRGVLDCTPPLMEHNVIQRVCAAQQQHDGGGGGDNNNNNNNTPKTDNSHQPEQSASSSSSSSQTAQPPQSMPKDTSIPPQPQQHQQQYYYSPPQSPLPHCNKFFPFTSGQLKRFDPKTYKALHYIWTRVIAQWKDPVLYGSESDSSCEEEEAENENMEVASHQEERECCRQLPCWQVWHKWRKQNAML
mmetsp:Transcript_22569/g.62734  ORF Transcript_22569/g.62734 Transcript_22569/m.62734 type:complete len:566 (+) Transcript_22569:124-1821(+)